MLHITGPVFPFCGFLCTCQDSLICALSTNGKKMLQRSYPILTSLFSLPTTVQSLTCARSPRAIDTLGSICHHHYNDQMNLHHEVRAKQLGRKHGGLTYILRENLASDPRAPLLPVQGLKVSQQLGAPLPARAYFLMGEKVQPAPWEEASKTGLT